MAQPTATPVDTTATDSSENSSTENTQPRRPPNSSVLAQKAAMAAAPSSTPFPEEFPKIAIVGAGVAGVAMAAALKDYKLDFCVFDQHETVGGLWADNYPGAKVQSTFDLYEYPGFPYPEEIRRRAHPPAPTAPEVVEYLQRFCEAKHIADKFYFNTCIEDICIQANGRYLIEFQNGKSYEFSFVIICSGLVSVKPKMIEIPGQESFELNGGEIIHSSQRRGKVPAQNVLVIGNGKSAVDAATAAAASVQLANAQQQDKVEDYPATMEQPKETTYAAPIQIARRASWYVPRYWFGFLPYKWCLHSRLAAFMLPMHYSVRNPLKILLHIVLTPFKWLFWRLVEIILRCHYWLPSKLTPRMGTIVKNLLDVSVLITDKEHLQRIRNKDIDMRVGTVTSLEPGKANLSDGTTVNVDTIVMATGWKLGFDTFMHSGLLLKDLDVHNDGLWLYRNIVSPNSRGLFFVGSNTLTFMNIFTAYLQAYWLAGLLAKERSWPTRTEMLREIEANKKFKRRYYPHHALRGASIEAYMQVYHDTLCRDMKARPAHKCLLTRPIADLLMPNTPMRMTGCVEPTEETKQRLLDAKKKRKQKRADQNGDAPLTMNMNVHDMPKAKFLWGE